MIVTIKEVKKVNIKNSVRLYIYILRSNKYIGNKTKTIKKEKSEIKCIEIA